jgi:hypothetical protein
MNRRVDLSALALSKWLVVKTQRIRSGRFTPQWITPNRHVRISIIVRPPDFRKRPTISVSLSHLFLLGGWDAVVSIDGNSRPARRDTMLVTRPNIHVQAPWTLSRWVSDKSKFDELNRLLQQCMNTRPHLTFRLMQSAESALVLVFGRTFSRNQVTNDRQNENLPTIRTARIATYISACRPPQYSNYI